MDLKDLVQAQKVDLALKVDSLVVLKDQVDLVHKAQAALDLKAQVISVASVDHKMDSLVLKDQVTLVDLAHKAQVTLVDLALKVDSLVLKDQVTLIISAALNKVQAALSQLLK